MGNAKEIVILNTLYGHIRQKPADFENSGRLVFTAFAVNIFLLMMYAANSTQH